MPKRRFGFVALLAMIVTIFGLLFVFATRPFALVGINGDEEPAKAKEAVEKAKIPWRSFAPDLGRRGGIPSAWNVFSWPTTYVIDHTGVIRHINLRRVKLDKPLEDLVAQAEEAKKSGGS